MPVRPGAQDPRTSPSDVRRPWWHRGRNPGANIYGIVVACSLLAGIEHLGVPVTRLGAYVFLTILLYWLAHAYADVLGHRPADTHLTVSTAERVVQALGDQWGVVGGTAVMLAVLSISKFSGASQNTSINLALWAGAIELFIWGAIAGRTAGLSGRAVTFYAFTSGALGVLIFVLKSIV